MTLLTMKKYIKSPILALSTTCFWGYIGFCLMKAKAHLAIEAIACVLKLQQISFLFFLFLSYEFFSMSKKNHCQEVISSIRGGQLKERIYQFGCLLLEAGILCVCLLVYVFYRGEPDVDYFLFSLRLIMIHCFLLYFLAIFLGLVFSIALSQAQAYFGMVIVYSIFSSKIISSIQQFSYGKEWMYRISDLLSLYSRDFSALSDSYYLFSVENVNIQRTAIWICVVACIFVCVEMKKWKKAFVLIPLGAVVLFGTYFMQPTCAVNVDNGVSGQDALTTDDTYYRVSENCEDESQYQSAEFQVASYKADFSVGRQLEARVTMKLTENKQQRYTFTLYHGYLVNKIEDSQGREVEFRQEGDYVTISGSEYDTLTFYYEGSCKRYYTTSQGIFLPAYLAYYPMPGKRKVYRIQYGYWGNSLETLGYEAFFDVKVNTKQEVFCNLQEVEDKHFKGESDGITIFASDFLEKTSLGKSTLITSALGEESKSLEEDRERYLSFLESYYTEEQQACTIFVPPYINGEFYYFGKDHVIGNISALEYYYQKYIETGDMYDLLTEEELENILSIWSEEETDD